MDDHAASEYVRLWDVQPVPIRPSRLGLAHYRNVMRLTPQASVLICGATPELVDLAIIIGASRIVRLDLSMEILLGMKNLATQDWSNVESVQGNWLEHQPGLDGAFDYVVCDGGPLFLEFPLQWRTFFCNVHRYLKPGGVFCFKGQAHPKELPSFESLRDKRIAHFKATSSTMPHQEKIARFWHLVAHLWQLCMVGLVAPDGKIDKHAVSARLDATGECVMQEFPDKRLQEIAHEALHKIFRNQDRTPILEYLTPPDLIAPYLTDVGFVLEPTQFLIDSEPLPDYCYQMTARKPLR
ncbi:MAG: class I SAM-dependent methyltransferase [Deltaproteobacteria bacterium]|nr:class I SAM-dependent methyltransferase [Deltaproteobacteria bacterium]